MNHFAESYKGFERRSKPGYARSGRVCGQQLRTAEAQQHHASGLALVTAAIALWNTAMCVRDRDSQRA